MKLVNLLLGSVALCIFLTSCMHVKSQVTVFHQFPDGYSGKSYAIVPDKSQVGSLEFNSYAQVLRQQMNTNGFREVPIETADLAVFVFYTIDNGHQVISSTPIMGQTGVTASSTSGNVQVFGNSASYSENTTYTPTYGEVGTEIKSRTEYTRMLEIDMVDRTLLSQGKIKKLYEGKATSNGRTGTLNEVLPTMIEEVFDRFPGKNGRTRTVDKTVHRQGE